MEDAIDQPMAYIEVSPCDLVTSKWKEYSVNTGATQSTLQDFKLPEFSGGYTYSDSNAFMSPTSNRFVYWRTAKDVIEFTELSLDSDLESNQLRLRFHNSPVIDCVSVNETPNEVIILIATVASIHKLTFLHPRKQAGEKSTKSGVLVRPSIFHKFSSTSLKDQSSFFVLQNTASASGSGGPNFPINCTSWLTVEKDAVFVLAHNSSVLDVIVMRYGDKRRIETFEFKQATLTEKLKGFLPAIMRSHQEAEDMVLSLTHQQFHDDTLVFALCRDMKIRIWSFVKQECIASQYLTKYDTGLISVRRPIFRKTISDGTLHLFAYTSSGDVSQFVVNKLVKEGQNYSLQNVATIYPQQNEDLLDLGVSGQELWTLWINSQMEVKIQHCTVEASSSDWKQVVLSSEVLPSFNISSLVEGSRNTFIEEIFLRGKFSVLSIAKAMAAFSRVKESSFTSMKTQMLIEELTKIIENKVRATEDFQRLDETAKRTLEKEHWEKFYSYCIQYKNVGNKPLGFLTDPKTGLVALLKKSSISLIVANDLTNNVILSPRAEISNLMTLTGDPLVHQSVSTILEGVSHIAQLLDEELSFEFESRVQRGEPADQVASDFAEKYISIGSIETAEGIEESFKTYISSLCSRCPNIFDAVESLNGALSLGDAELFAIINNGRSTLPIFNEVFSSSSGVSVVCEALKLVSRLRYNFCRDLLLFQCSVLLVRDKCSISFEKLDRLRETSIPSGAMHVQAYCWVNWICEAPYEPGNLLGNEQTESMLNTLELTEYLQPSKQTSGQEVLPKSLLSFFVEKRGGLWARKYISERFSNSEDLISSESWNIIFPHYVNVIMQMIWPITLSFHFPEFLLGTSQLGVISDYIRLLDPWCDANPFSRQFIGGYVALVNDDCTLAVECFKSALHGAHEEPFLRRICGLSEIVGDDGRECSLTPDITFKYFNKIVQLFKLYGKSDAIVNLIAHALTLLDESKDADYKEHMSCLQTTLFIHQLELDRVDEAYEVMVSNNDLSQRKDCLRQFIIRMCSRNHLEKLVGFEYPDLRDDFISILEARARSTDLTTPQKSSYYEILFAFYSKSEDFKKCANVMFEYARRLSQELHGVESLEKQLRCLLVVLNCLKLVEKKFAWVATVSKPNSQSVLETPSLKPSTALKRTSTGENCPPPNKREVTVYGVEELKIEYELVKARHRLLTKDGERNKMAIMSLTADELITLLISNSMFDAAFNLCQIAKRPRRAVFEGIVSKYIHLVYMPDAEASDTLDEVYDCFAENETPFQTYVGSAESTPIDKMWHLIDVYLNKFEKPSQSQIHKCIAEKLLEVGIKLPTSLRISYQKRNCPELLWLLMTYNFIEDSVSLALDYVDAFLNKGYEEFDIKVPLFPNSPPVYFPHNHMQNLLSILEDEQGENPSFAELNQSLQGKLKTYEEIAIQESRNMLASY
ncbi:Nuclear pore complex protein [Halotydeus destructor]|nr:Nuclear pore complex protein [Halotydeus destructor]